VRPTGLGEHLRERATPTRLEKGILTVAVLDAEWKREFKEHASQIVYKLNRAFGTKRVERIDLKVDRKAVESSRSRLESDIVVNSGRDLVSEDLVNASKSIADPNLRDHFLEAAAACIELRDSK
jgi:hypothetical protein